MVRGRITYYAGAGLRYTAIRLESAYNEEFSKISPGTILLEYALKNYCVQNNIEVVNLVSDANWLQKWQPIKMNTYEMKIYPNGLRGILGKLIFLNLKLFSTSPCFSQIRNKLFATI